MPLLASVNRGASIIVRSAHALGSVSARANRFMEGLGVRSQCGHERGTIKRCSKASSAPSASKVQKQLACPRVVTASHTACGGVWWRGHERLCGPAR